MLVTAKKKRIMLASLRNISWSVDLKIVRNSIHFETKY